MALTGLIYNTAKENDREQWRRSLAEAGLTLVDGSFEEGATVNSKTDVVWHISSGQCYAWYGAFPKDVPAGLSPVGNSDWKPQTGPNLRDDLISAASGKGRNLVTDVQGTNNARTINEVLSDLKSVKS